MITSKPVLYSCNISEDDMMAGNLENDYVKMVKEEPRVEAVHTGLECGIFGGHCEGLDSVSFGPNILDIHSINEKLDLASVERMWRFLLEVLKACK